MEEIKVTRCSDVKHELEKAAIVFKTEVKNLDFEVVGVTTFLENQDGSERKTLNAQEAKEFFVSREYEEEGWLISQAYDLVIGYNTCHIGTHKKSYEVVLENGNSELYLICTKESYEEFVEDIKSIRRIVNAQKALMKVVFLEFDYLFDEKTLQEALNQAQDFIGGRKKILLERSLFYSPVRDAYFYFTVQEEWEFVHQESLEGSLYAVKTGSEVGRLYRSNSGSDGRNLLGEFISIQKKEPLDLELGVLNDDFRIEEQGNCNVYYALKDGFVGQNNSGLVLVKDFKFDEINHRNMGNLLGGLECGFSISAKAPNVDKDALGSGIVVEAVKVQIEGSIDQGAIIRAQECSISGSIHQGAEIYATQVNVGTHKGRIEANMVEIKMCEGGFVDCENGEFGEVMGSEISCKTAKIGRLYANNKISFCQKLEINEFCKGGNSFVVDSTAFLGYRQEVEKIEKKQQKILTVIEKLQRIYKQELLQAKKMKPAIERFKVIFSKNMQQGVQTQPYILTTIGEYIGLCRRIKKIKARIKDYQEQIELIKIELEPISNISLGARLEVQTPWVEENKIEYINHSKTIHESLIIENGERVNLCIDSQYYKILKERIK